MIESTTFFASEENLATYFFNKNSLHRDTHNTLTPIYEERERIYSLVRKVFEGLFLIFANLATLGLINLSPDVRREYFPVFGITLFEEALAGKNGNDKASILPLNDKPLKAAAEQMSHTTSTHSSEASSRKSILEAQSVENPSSFVSQKPRVENLLSCGEWENGLYRVKTLFQMDLPRGAYACGHHALKNSLAFILRFYGLEERFLDINFYNDVYNILPISDFERYDDNDDLRFSCLIERIEHLKKCPLDDLSPSLRTVAELLRSNKATITPLDIDVSCRLASWLGEEELPRYPNIASELSGIKEIDPSFDDEALRKEIIDEVGPIGLLDMDFMNSWDEYTEEKSYHHENLYKIRMDKFRKMGRPWFTNGPWRNDPARKHEEQLYDPIHNLKKAALLAQNERCEEGQIHLFIVAHDHHWSCVAFAIDNSGSYWGGACSYRNRGNHLQKSLERLKKIFHCLARVDDF